MKGFLLALSLLSSSVWAFSEPHLYSRLSAEPGYEVKFSETRRGKDISTLKVELLKADAQAGYGIIDAAVEIAQARGKAYFVILNSQPIPDGEVMSLYFTNDKQSDLLALFGAQMSEEAKRNFNKNGYNNVKDLLKVFALMEAVAQ